MPNAPPAARYFAANHGNMAAYLPARYSSVLEVGCAAGGFRQHLKLKHTYWGLEPNAEAARQAATILDRVITGIYDDTTAATLPDCHFDLVICNDVIEHMVDHDHFLEHIKTKMRPGGCIVGSIPNVRHITALFKLLVSRDWPYSDSGILDRTHLRFFTEKSLRRTFTAHGWSVEALAGINSVITHGVHREDGQGSAVRDGLERAIAASVVAATLGFYADTQYPQFAFRVRLP
jgi:2-polyprenyl-3-methyl-5-hydroxy-6-metoxy-1,4-benzoquinol methylase